MGGILLFRKQIWVLSSSVTSSLGRGLMRGTGNEQTHRCGGRGELRRQKYIFDFDNEPPQAWGSHPHFHPIGYIRCHCVNVSSSCVAARDYM